MAKKNDNNNRGGFFTSGPQDAKPSEKRNPYPTISESAKKSYSHGYMQSQVVGLQGDIAKRNNTPDIHVLPSKVAHADPEPGPGTDAQRQHIARMRANKQLT